jgi:UDP:flavonoid glycosyltransferase YjiC (YdhE family)
MGRDQPDNAARVEARGAGLTLSPDAAPSDIRAALARLLEEPAFRGSARRLAERLEARQGQVDAVEEIERVAHV